MIKKIEDAPAVFTLKDACEFLRLSDITIVRLAEKGAIPGYKFGRQWRFTKEAVLHLMKHPEALGSNGE